MNVDRIASFINNSKTTQRVLRAVSDNPALASAGVSFVAAAMLRPAAQGMLPIKDPCRQKIYNRFFNYRWGYRISSRSGTIYTSK